MPVFREKFGGVRGKSPITFYAIWPYMKRGSFLPHREVTLKLRPPRRIPVADAGSFLPHREVTLKHGVWDRAPGDGAQAHSSLTGRSR